MKSNHPHEIKWAQHTGAILLAPFRFIGDVVFCAFVVFAAFWMLLLCTLLATLDHMVIEPWKLHHTA